MSSRICIVLAAFVGCSGTAKPAAVVKATAPTPPAPPVLIALGYDAGVEIVAVTPAATKTVRDVTVPGYITDLQWIQSDPIVLLDAPSCDMPEGSCSVDPAAVGVIGKITEHGFVPYPKLPESTWAGLTPPDGNLTTQCEVGCWQLSVRDDAVYEGHCLASFPADGQWICNEWLYARIDVPGPAMKELPKVPLPPPPPSPTRKPPPPPPPLAVTPSPLVKIEFLAQEEEARYGGKLTQLRCTQGAQTTLYPENVADLDLGMGEKVEWLTTDPPRFLVEHWHDGFMGFSDNVLFTGCSPEIVAATISGPDDVEIVNGLLFQRGKVLGSVPSAKLVKFSP